MFSIIDRDGNGFISFRELLYAVLLFAQGNYYQHILLIVTISVLRTVFCAIVFFKFLSRVSITAM